MFNLSRKKKNHLLVRFQTYFATTIRQKLQAFLTNILFHPNSKTDKIEIHVLTGQNLCDLQPSIIQNTVIEPILFFCYKKHIMCAEALRGADDNGN